MSLPNINKKTYAIEDWSAQTTKMVKIDTLFQTKTAKTPYPSAPHWELWGAVCNNSLSNDNISLKNLFGLEIIKRVLELLNFTFMYYVM